MSEKLDGIKEDLVSKLGLEENSINQLELFDLFFLFLCFSTNNQILDTTFIKTFNMFCEYNERGLIEKNDVSEYSSFEEINDEVKKAQDKIDEKRAATEINRIFDNEEWIILRPLSHLSSRKYGSNTKWCTTSSSPTQFNNYSKGILIYTINKKSGLKVAIHKYLDKNDITWWNSEDKSISIDETQLPEIIIQIIQNELSENHHSNVSIVTGEDDEGNWSFFNLPEIELPTNTISYEEKKALAAGRLLEILRSRKLRDLMRS